MVWGAFLLRMGKLLLFGITDMKKLAEVFADFQRLKFPRSPSNELLDDIFADLVQYDNQIAGSVDKLLKGKTLRSTDLYFDVELEKRLRGFIIEAKSKEDISSAESYLQYLNSLKDLISVAEKNA